MKVQFMGGSDLQKITEKLEEVVENTLDKIEREQEGVQLDDWEIQGAEFTVKVKVRGLEEMQVITVEHHEGHPEMLTWIVDLSKDIIANNEQESQYDAYTVTKAIDGKDFDFKEVATLYDDGDLQFDPELSSDYGDMSRKIYDHVGGFKVARVYQKDKLIQEFKLTEK